jgi:2EXR family
MTDPNISPASFSALPLEIRQRIWELTLPASRIIRVILAPPNSKVAFAETAAQSYKTLSSSWGGTIPQALHIDRESRAFALTRFTERFNCYWNFGVDLLYVELPFLGQVDVASKQLYDMRKRGLLDGVKHLAVDWEMWDNMFRPWTEEHWYVLLLVISLRHRSLTDLE